MEIQRQKHQSYLWE